MKLRFVATVALLSLAVALLGACGSSGSGSEEEGAANQPSSEAEQEDQSDAEETETPEEEEPSSACLDASPSKTKFTVLAADKAGFGYFKPKKLEVPAGEKITIVYKNETTAAHDFVIDSLECDTGVVNKATVTLTAPSKPTEFRCTIHDFMTGKLIPIG